MHLQGEQTNKQQQQWRRDWEGHSPQAVRGHVRWRVRALSFPLCRMTIDRLEQRGRGGWVHNDYALLCEDKVSTSWQTCAQRISGWPIDHVDMHHDVHPAHLYLPFSSCAVEHPTLCRVRAETLC